MILNLNIDILCFLQRDSIERVCSYREFHFSLEYEEIYSDFFGLVKF